MEEKMMVKKIMNSYVKKEESKLDQLKKLDSKVKKPAKIFAYIFGVVGSLVLGLGMTLAMEIIFDFAALGIVIGITGIIMVSFNYNIYSIILEKRKKKFATIIIELSKDLLNE